MVVNGEQRWAGGARGLPGAPLPDRWRRYAMPSGARDGHAPRRRRPQTPQPQNEFLRFGFGAVGGGKSREPTRRGGRRGLGARGTGWGRRGMKIIPRSDRQRRKFIHRGCFGMWGGFCKNRVDEVGALVGAAESASSINCLLLGGRLLREKRGVESQCRNQNIMRVSLGYLCRVRLKFNVKLK